MILKGRAKGRMAVALNPNKTKIAVYLCVSAAMLFMYGVTISQSSLLGLSI